MHDLETLRNSFDVEPPTPAAIQHQRIQLETFIRASSTDAPANPTRERRPWMIVAIALPAVALLAAAGWAILPRDATTASSTSCEIDGDIYGFLNDGSPPIEACRQVWVDAGAADNIESVPPLTVCVFSDDQVSGVVVVEGAGSETCSNLDYAPWTEQREYLEAGAALTATLRSLGISVPNPPTPDRCIAETELVNTLRTNLDSRGLGEWSIDVQRDASEPECFSVRNLDLTNQTVQVEQAQG